MEFSSQAPSPSSYTQQQELWPSMRVPKVPLPRQLPSQDLTRANGCYSLAWRGPPPVPVLTSQPAGARPSLAQPSPAQPGLPPDSVSQAGCFHNSTQLGFLPVQHLWMEQFRGLTWPLVQQG